MVPFTSYIRSAHTSIVRSLILLAISLVGLAAEMCCRAEEVDFARDVQPILAKRCVACHGPSVNEGGLRLTDKEISLAKLDSGATAIVPGQPAKSELIRRVSSEDESERMPPEGPPLTPVQIESLKKWIEQGAVWKEHWGFVKPVRHETPPVDAHQDWVRNEIDQMVLRRLLDRELVPAPPADDAVLIRRAYYDLTGLPPTPEQVQEYVSDTDDGKYARLVDELLDSRHFGEQWARHWLDLVRFAETNSYERDGSKPQAWRYRDYVIRGFNKDLPYNQFIVEQLAGDELDNPTADQIIATGYYRLGIWDDEPADPELARYDGLDDIVSTTGQTFLGLTINCARCHDHKIDPITQSDYYGLLAFFHNITPYSNSPERILRPIFGTEQERNEYDRKVRGLEEQRNSVQAKIGAIEEQFLVAFRSAGNQVSTADIDDLRFSFYRSSWDKLPAFAEIKAEEMGELPNGRFDLSPASRGEDFGFVFEGVLKVSESGVYQFELDSDDGARLSINGATVVEHDGIHKLGAGERASTTLNAGRLPIRLEYFQRRETKGLAVAWSGPGFERRILSASQGIDNDMPMEVAKSIEQHGQQYLDADQCREYQRLTKELDALKKRSVPADQALCVTESGTTAPETFILTRGSPHAPADKVGPRVPTILGGGELVCPPLNTLSTGRRSVLAGWIASRDNVQTSRVMVNRIWQHLFGRGIVRSTSNYGIMGTPPTHPELLDWLALRFMDDGWSIKSMIRLIMLSNTYRMSSVGNETALAVDPGNDLFWRQNMRRLSAEEIRDSILAVGGTLNLAVYGPSVFPTIPKEVLAGQSQPGSGWGKSSVEEQARRSVYVYVKRSLHLPLLESFDSAETDITCPERFVTTQPTQALGLLNGEFSNQQAAILAERMKRERGDDRLEQVRRSLSLVTQRDPSEPEVEKGCRLIHDLIEQDGADPELALRTFCLMALNMNEFVNLD